MVTAVIIDYKSYELTYAYVMHLKEQSDMPISVVIVDNSDADDNFLALVRIFQESWVVPTIKVSQDLLKACELREGYQLEKDGLAVAIVQNMGNDGFAKGNNRGIRLAKELFDPRRILITNNDIQITDPHTLSKLDAVFEKQNNVCLVGPYIVGLDGERQSPHRDVNLRHRWVYPYIFWPFFSMMWRINKSYVQHYTSDIIDKNEDGPVYRVIAAFAMADTKKFMEMGMFDEATFLYAEEMILGERIRNAGMVTYYLHDAKIIHEQGVTTKKALGDMGKRLKGRLETESYYYREYKHVSKFWIKVAQASLQFYRKTYLSLMKKKYN